MTTFEAPPRYEEYERQRQEGPVTWSVERNAWLVTGFAECDQALRDGETFGGHSQRAFLTEERWNDLSATLGGERSLVLLPEPEHSRLVTMIRRRMASNMPHFLEHRVHPVVQEHLDAFLDGATGNFSDDFTYLLPPAAVASLLGMPWQDKEMLARWKAWDELTIELVSRYDVKGTEDGRRVSREMCEVMLPYVEARRDDPQDDFISQLWDVVPQVLPGATAEDIVAQCRQIMLGGSRSTSHLLNNCGVLLFSDPALWARLKADPDEVDLFIEEVLRVITIVQQRARVVTKDTVLGGQELHAGDHVYLILPAANRDAEQYACPHAVSLDPANRRRHLAFGAGPKTCAGMALARAEAKHAIQLLLTSIDNPRLDPDRPAPVYDAEGVAGAWRPVHVQYDDIRA